MSYTSVGHVGDDAVKLIRTDSALRTKVVRFELKRALSLENEIVSQIEA